VSATVSIVTATYNYARFLADALDSVRGQTFTDWEAIVVDDGSTDNTADVIRPYLSDSRIRYYQTDHLGQPAAKNFGIRMANSPLIAFLDADDLWLPSKLELQVPLFREDPELGVAYTRRLVMDEDGWLLEGGDRGLFRGHVLRNIFGYNFVCFSSAMIRRAVIEDVGPFDEGIPLAIDYEFWLRVARHYRFDYVEEPLVLYRTGHANLSQRGEERRIVGIDITRRFLDEYGGRQLLSPALVRRTLAAMYADIGLAKRDRRRIEALAWYLRALWTLPQLARAWKGIATVFLPERVRRCIRQACGRPITWTWGRRYLSSDGQRISATDLLSDASLITSFS
jgi:glycosyltransferase involved in cell wall biosynthesis